ncbi:MAG: GNVR domain-containing protein [Candidatus Eisenbacteria bacterium]
MDDRFSFSDEISSAVQGLWKRRNWIFRVSMAVAAFAAFVSLLVPNVFEARATFLATQQEGGGWHRRWPPPERTSRPDSSASPSTPVDVFKEVLESRTVGLGIVDELGLVERYGIDEEDPEKARILALLALKGQIEVAQKRSGLVAVQVQVPTGWLPVLRRGQSAKAARLAADIGNEAVRQLNRVLQERRASSARNSRAYLETELEKNRVQMEVAADSLVAFQKRHATLSIEEQAKVTVQMLGTLQGQIVAKEIELDVVGETRTPSSYEYQRVRTELEALKDRYAELLRGEPAQTIGAAQQAEAGFEPITSLPDIAMELLRRTREAELQHTVYKLLTTQYYQARLEEARDTPTVEILDEAIVPLGKKSPQRKMIVVLAFLGGAVLASAWELLRHRPPAAR